MKWSDVITSTQYVHNGHDAWEWFLWLSWEWETLIGLGIFGLIVIIWRFITATMPYKD